MTSTTNLPRPMSPTTTPAPPVAVDAVDEVVARARAAAPSWRRVPPAERAGHLRRAASAVRECAATYELQARSGRVAPEALEAILSRTTVLIAQRLDGHDPRLLAALLPGMVRTMLQAFVELLEEKGGS